MVGLAIGGASRLRLSALMFPAATFLSAALVFMVEPMVARLLLPRLGGSPAVWNTSMAFFQAALLAGYGYAHLLQRLPTLRLQALTHLAALAAAALFLPLHISQAFGDPGPSPAPWLLGVLIVSVGAPFAVLSATAPLVQAWYARAFRGEADADNPYVLYAASNLGSLIGLLAYPVLIEPTLTLNAQTLVWSGGFGLFTLAAAALAARVWNTPAALQATHAATTSPINWRTRLTWVALAALPSSLMLGVTTHISTDVASAPFLWVAPLALYLLTFVVAFQARPTITADTALRWQTVLLLLVVILMAMATMSYGVTLVVHLACFFFCALVCHQALVARRPAAEHLTEFYLMMSLGGVVGGAFNAFAAPALFSFVAEYPVVLALTALVRPSGDLRPAFRDLALLAAGLAAIAFLYFIRGVADFAGLGLLALPVIAAAGWMLRARGGLFAALIVAMLVQNVIAADPGRHVVFQARSFFGVHRVMESNVAQLGGPVRMLTHGTTMHGAQPLSPALRCRAGAYYARHAALGQAWLALQAERPAMRIGVVGLGAGSLATYARRADRVRYFEIDPVVVQVARNPAYFSFLSECAQGPVDVVLGDARLTLAREPAGSFDLITLDAFSSDAIPTHLLTVEAMQLYLRDLSPNGVILMHISNRNLALRAPVAAAARQLGLVALWTRSHPAPGTNSLAENTTEAMILARTPQALAAFTRDPRWTTPSTDSVRAWTDDYTNVPGALVAHWSNPEG